MSKAYTSNLTRHQFELIEPVLPKAKPGEVISIWGSNQGSKVPINMVQGPIEGSAQGRSQKLSHRYQAIGKGQGGDGVLGP